VLVLLLVQAQTLLVLGQEWTQALLEQARA
jgi:hypothetical protein